MKQEYSLMNEMHTIKQLMFCEWIDIEKFKQNKKWRKIFLEWNLKKISSKNDMWSGEFDICMKTQVEHGDYIKKEQEFIILKKVFGI